MSGRRRKGNIEDKESSVERIKKSMQRALELTVYSKPLKTELINILSDLCKIYSPTDKEKDVVTYCSMALMNAGFEVYVDKVQNVFATRASQDGTKLVCINAHTDTVQGESDKGIANTLQYLWWDDLMFGNGNMMGGDDKCGIAIALTLALHTNLPMKIILTSGEERGGKGVAELKKSDFDNVGFCLTIDRRGANDSHI